MEILLILLEVVGEIALCVFSDLAWGGLLSSVLDPATPQVEIPASVAVGALSLAAGALIGGLSLLVLPHPLISAEILRAGNLLLTPALAAFIAVRIAGRRARPARLSAAMAFAFALGLLAARYIGAA